MRWLVCYWCGWGEPQPRWSQWHPRWAWNGASSPTGEPVAARRLSQVSRGRSTGESSRRANFKKPNTPQGQYWKQAATKQTANCGDPDPSGFLLVSAGVKKRKSAPLSCNTSALMLTPSVQRANRGKLCCHSPSLFLFKRQLQVLIISGVLLLLMGTSH